MEFGACRCGFSRTAVCTGTARATSFEFEVSVVLFSDNGVSSFVNVCHATTNRVGGKEKFTTSGSTSTKKYSKGGNPTAVPALVLPDGSVLADSWDIALNCFKDDSLGPDDERRRFLDSELGPDTRQLCYAWLLKPSNATIWNELITSPRFGTFWKYLWSYFGLGSRVTKTMSKVFHATDEAATKEVSDRVDQHFAKMSSRLKQRQGTLNGSAGLMSGSILSHETPPPSCGMPQAVISMGTSCQSKISPSAPSPLRSVHVAAVPCDTFPIRYSGVDAAVMSLVIGRTSPGVLPWLVSERIRCRCTSCLLCCLSRARPDRQSLCTDCSRQ